MLDIQISSLELLKEYINPARLTNGETEHMPNKFHAKIRNLLGDLIVWTKYTHPQNGQKYDMCNLTYDQAIMISMRESVNVYKSVCAKFEPMMSLPTQLPEPTSKFDYMNVLGEFEISSLDYLKHMINPMRLQAGESEVRNNDFLARIEDELEDEFGGIEELRKIRRTSNSNALTGGRTSNYYLLNYDQAMLIGMRESKGVRKKVLSTLKDLLSKVNGFVPNNTPVPGNTLDMLQLMLDAAKEQETKLLAVEAKVDKVVDSLSSYRSLSEQLLPDHITIHKGWREHCNIVSYDTFQEFFYNYNLPKKKLIYVPENTIVKVETYQVKISDLLQLHNDIINGATQISNCFYSHEKLTRKFRLKI